MNEGHIYIYGVIDSAVEGRDYNKPIVNLTDVINQIQQNKGAKSLTVHIHSPGGDVNEGFAIHDALINSGKEVNTIIEGLCASIATVIALAGTKRSMTENSEFMIHNPWGGIMGESDDIKRYGDQLEKIENKVANFYSVKTKLSQNELLTMMKSETWMSAEEAKNFGFITDIITQIKAVAKFKNEDKMSKETIKNLDEQVGILSGLVNSMAKFFKPVKALALQDTSGAEIMFDKAAGVDDPAVGDKATVDGSPASGDYVMPDGTTYNFENGELMSITEPSADDEVEQMAEEITALKADVAAKEKLVFDKEAEIKNLKSEMEAKAKEFETQITSIKASIKSLSVETGNRKPEDDSQDDEPIRVGRKRKAS